VRSGWREGKKGIFRSGSAGVESAIKFSRAATGKTGLLYADGAFHGLTCGALSPMGGGFWREKFGTDAFRYHGGSVQQSRGAAAAIGNQTYAASLSPIQSEAGIRLPDADYLKAARDLCVQHDALFVLDEVQTGMYRTGRFLAAHHYGVEPDMVILAKALSGGLIPCSAVLMSDRVYEAVYDSLKRAIVHTSTFSETGGALQQR
jgi:ornithine--oxo-acid transaminase